MASFSFADVGRTLDARAAAIGAAPPKTFLPKDAKERYTDGSDGLRGHMPGHASLIEILASRYYYVANGCDYENESLLTMALRVLGWGGRLAFYVFSLVFVLMAMAHERNPLGEYMRFSRERDTEGTLRDDPTDIFEAFVYFVFGVWVVAIASEMLSYLVGRAGASRPYGGQCSVFPLLLFNRVALDAEDGRCCWVLALMLFYLAAGALATVMLHTMVGHVFVTRNLWMAILLGMMTAFQLLGALADAVSLGGIDGLSVGNKPASWVASVRIIVVMPVLVITSVALIIMSFPTYSDGW
jgi:hypothetical protein